MICPINSNSRQYPDAIGLIGNGDVWTYAALNTEVEKTTTLLSSQGIKEGTRVGCKMELSPGYVITLFALFRLKAVAIPLNSRFPDEKLLLMLDEVICDFLISDAYTSNRIRKHRFKLIESDVLRKHDRRHNVESEIIMEVHKAATILFSSGSTGSPKAIMHSWGNHYYSALGSNTNIPLNVGDRWLLSLPLFHVAGIAVLFRCFIAGATVVVPEAKEHISTSLTRDKITHLSLVSTQLKRLLDAEKVNGWPHLKAILVGGSAVSRLLIERAFDAQLPVFTTYGLTEMASQVTTTSPGSSLDVCHTSGKVLPHREIRCSEDQEILVRGKTLFLGYVEKKNVIHSLDAEGWFHTGDLGEIDKNGLLNVKGRRDNMFISGGENIYPEEVEKVLEKYPEVRRAVVVPVLNKEFGARPVAFIDTDDLKAVSKRLDQFLKDKLARYMWPIAYFEWDVIDNSIESKGLRIAFRKLAESMVAARET